MVAKVAQAAAPDPVAGDRIDQKADHCAVDTIGYEFGPLCHGLRNDGSDTEVHQVFHNNVTCVFGSCEACFYHCESGLHKEDQCGADQHPYCVY